MTPRAAYDWEPGRFFIFIFFILFYFLQRLVSARVQRGWMPEGGDIQVGLEHFDPLRSLKWKRTKMRGGTELHHNKQKTNK